jgi:hypothetical protein
MTDPTPTTPIAHDLWRRVAAVAAQYPEVREAVLSGDAIQAAAVIRAALPRALQAIIESDARIYRLWTHDEEYRQDVLTTLSRQMYAEVHLRRLVDRMGGA